MLFSGLLWRTTLICGVLLAGVASAAHGQTGGALHTVVCSTTQVADFARQVAGDRWRILCVLGAGQDPHLYEPTVSDAQIVSSADLCLQNGWHLEGGNWMENLASNAGKRLVSCVQGIEPITLPGDDVARHDPHAWFSPRNAAIYVRNITSALSEMDPERADEYAARAELYLNQLRALHTWIQSQVSKIPANRRVLVTHHDAFGYFCQEYGFRSVSPGGWTTEEIAATSIERRQQVVQAIRETGVRSIFVETSLDRRMIIEIAREAGVEIGGQLYSDAMGAPGTAGETYLGMMRENVLTILAGLN